jgi:hypothetical protein
MRRNFFFVAELTKRTALGLDCGRTLRRAADRILLDPSAGAHNTVEITGLTVRRFLGLYWVTVTADKRALYVRESRSAGANSLEWPNLRACGSLPRESRAAFKQAAHPFRIGRTIDYEQNESEMAR